MANSKIKAQVAIEFTVALFCLLVFLVAITKIFVWFEKSIVEKHAEYEKTRSQAATGTTTAAQVNFYQGKQKPLEIFKDWKVK